MLKPSGREDGSFAGASTQVGRPEIPVSRAMQTESSFNDVVMAPMPGRVLEPRRDELLEDPEPVDCGSNEMGA